MLGKLKPADRRGWSRRCKRSKRCSAAKPAAEPTQPAPIVLRAPVPGDFGWMVTRHAELYAQEYSWSEPFEGLCAQIVADFVNNNDPKRERCWIAEMDGENVGCVMLVKDRQGQRRSARLRLLLVDPKARGLGLGQRLVDECVTLRARAPATRRSRCGRIACSPPRATFIRKPAFTLIRSEKKHRAGAGRW